MGVRRSGASLLAAELYGLRRWKWNSFMVQAYSKRRSRGLSCLGGCRLACLDLCRVLMD